MMPLAVSLAMRLLLFLLFFIARTSFLYILSGFFYEVFFSFNSFFKKLSHLFHTIKLYAKGLCLYHY